MTKKNILGKIKELFQIEYFQADYQTTDGRIIRCYGEGLEVGSKIKEITEDGEVDLQDGDIELKDGLVITLVNGAITEIEEATSMEDEQTDEEMTDKKDDMEYQDKEKMADLETTLLNGTKVKVIGGELVVGAKVEAEIDGKFIPAPEGQHDLSDGRVIFVDKDGLINKIETPTTEKLGEHKEDEKTEMDEVYGMVEKVVEEMKKLKLEINKMKKQNTELTSNFQKFAKEPQAEPTKHEPKFKITDREEKLKFFAKK